MFPYRERNSSYGQTPAATTAPVNDCGESISGRLPTSPNEVSFGYDASDSTLPYTYGSMTAIPPSATTTMVIFMNNHFLISMFYN